MTKAESFGFIGGAMFLGIRALFYKIITKKVTENCLVEKFSYTYSNYEQVDFLVKKSRI